MCNKPYLYLGVLLDAVLLVSAGCVMSPDSPHLGANQQPQGSFTRPRQLPDAALPGMTTVRFVSGVAATPGLFSEGSYVDDRHAWVNDAGDLKRTTDGGLTWQTMRPSDEDEPKFGRIGDTYVRPYFVTPTHGWLSAAKGVWRTEDGGETWHRALAEDSTSPRFTSESHGWVALYTKNFQQSYVTKDGGETWQPCGPKRSLNQQLPNNAFFLTPRLGWAITSNTDGERRNIYGAARTADGGCSWEQLWTGEDDPDQRFCEIYFLNERAGWLAGCFVGGGLFQSKDGGKTWQEVPTPTESATAIHVYFISPQEGWIITKATASLKLEGMYHTTNGGRSWRQLSEGEIMSGFAGSKEHNLIPVGWNAGRLFQMIYASRLRASLEGLLLKSEVTSC